MRDTKIRTRTQDGMIEVLVLVNHPMETGLRKDKATKQTIPAHFITQLVIDHNGKNVAVVNMGVGVSENPLIGVRLAGAKDGDKVKASWKDNKGETGSAEAVIEG